MMGEPDVSYKYYYVWPKIRRWTEIGLTEGNRVHWFVVQLDYSPTATWTRSGEWNQVARFDHHPHRSWGHDIRDEGLHMDVYADGQKVDVWRTFPDVPVQNAPAFAEETFDSLHEELIETYVAESSVKTL